MKDLIETIDLMKERIAKLAAERDAAVADMKLCWNPCEVCKYKDAYDLCEGICELCESPCPCLECFHNSNFEWRGVVGGEEQS